MKVHQNYGLSTRILHVVIFILFLGIIVILVNVYELRRLNVEYLALQASAIPEGKFFRSAEENEVRRKPTVWLNAENTQTGYLNHVISVFERVGYSIVKSSNLSETSSPFNWDVMWSHEYPFTERNHLNLEHSQRVNHFPGTGWVTNKVSLVTGTSFSYMPIAFRMPEQKSAFLYYVKKHSELLWVQKSSGHRGVKIIKTADIDLTIPDTFIQRYVDKPYLIDGRKFDIGVYVVLTSINPLRLYMLENDVLIRFCPADYLPFDPLDVDKYVVADDYTPMWEMPSLRDLYDDMSYNFKETFNYYLRRMGKDPTKIWEKIKAAVREVYLDKERNLIAASSEFKSTESFFELVRFDFVLDEELNVFLMEVNMSPNLSSGHFKENKYLYEEVVFNLISLVGLTASIRSPELEKLSQDAFHMIASDRDVMVNADDCIHPKCSSCLKLECRLCRRCLTPSEILTFRKTVNEYLSRRHFVRVFPPQFNQAQLFEQLPSPMNSPIYVNSDKLIHLEISNHFSFKDLTDKNKLMYLWFRSKCVQNIYWC